MNSKTYKFIMLALFVAQAVPTGIMWYTNSQCEVKYNNLKKASGDVQGDPHKIIRDVLIVLTVLQLAEVVCVLVTLLRKYGTWRKIVGSGVSSFAVLVTTAAVFMLISSCSIEEKDFLYSKAFIGTAASATFCLLLSSFFIFDCFDDGNGNESWGNRAPKYQIFHDGRKMKVSLFDMEQECALSRLREEYPVEQMEQLLDNKRK